MQNDHKQLEVQTKISTFAFVWHAFGTFNYSLHPQVGGVGGRALGSLFQTFDKFGCMTPQPESGLGFQF
jgi:hypothetical protein